MFTLICLSASPSAQELQHLIHLDGFLLTELHSSLEILKLFSLNNLRLSRVIGHYFFGLSPFTIWRFGSTLTIHLDSIPSTSTAKLFCRTVFSSKASVTRPCWLAFESVVISYILLDHELRIHNIQRTLRSLHVLFRISYATSEIDWQASTFFTFGRFALFAFVDDFLCAGPRHRSCSLIIFFSSFLTKFLLDEFQFHPPSLFPSPRRRRRSGLCSVFQPYCRVLLLHRCKPSALTPTCVFDKVFVTHDSIRHSIPRLTSFASREPVASQGQGPRRLQITSVVTDWSHSPP